MTRLPPDEFFLTSPATKIPDQVKQAPGTLYIEPESPRENAYYERFNRKLRDECLNREIFYSLRDAQEVIENWRVEYNTRRSRPKKRV